MLWFSMILVNFIGDIPNLVFIYDVQYTHKVENYDMLLGGILHYVFVWKIGQNWKKFSHGLMSEF